MSYNAFRIVRPSVPALSVGVITPVAVTWTPPLPNTNYTVQVTLIEATGLVTMDTATNKTASGCTLNLKNVGTALIAAGAAVVEVRAEED